MTQGPLVLPSSGIVGTQGLGSAFRTWWDSNGIIIDGTYINPSPDPEIIAEHDIAYNDDMILRQTGTDPFVFKLQLLDLAFNKNDALGAIEKVWQVVQGDRYWMDEYYRVNDSLFRSTIANFSLADSLQERP